MRASEAPSGTAIMVVGGLLVAVYVAATFLVMASTPYDLWGAMLSGPVMIAVSIPIFIREARREADPRLVGILLAALILKMLGSLLRYWVTFSVYGAGDATGYHREGAAIAHGFLNGDFNTGLPSLTGTDFMSFATALVYVVIGPSKLGGFLAFSWLGFWGLFLFYRAFVIAVPGGDRRTYALLVFFLPSLLYWPSSTGKEAWMVLTLGIASYGVARILTGSALPGAIGFVGGALLAAIVRPHVAGMLAIAALGGLIFLRPKAVTGRLGPVLKWAAIGGVVAVSLLLIRQTQTFLRASVLSPQGVVSELQSVSVRSDTGGSAFDPIVVRSPLQIPEAAVTVLFRPFVFEANNAQAALAALESAALMVFVVLRWRWIWTAVLSLRRIPYIAFAGIYTGLFVIVFASFPNFGLLARERVQLLPLFLVLLCVTPRPRPRGVEESPQHLDVRAR